MESVGLELTCKMCEKLFLICRSCYRGHVYCSSSCKIEGKKKTRKEAQHRYEKTLKGKKARSKRQARYRKRKNDVHRWSNVAFAVEASVLSQVIDGHSSSSNEIVTHTSYINKNIFVKASVYRSESFLIQAKICSVCRIQIERVEKVSERKRMEASKL